MTNNEHDKNVEHEHHLTPLSMYFKVFAGLITLTIITVATSMFDFGFANIVVAMLIAVAKACLVVFFFMQLKYDDKFNKMTFASAFVFLSIFILITASDLFFRRVITPMKVEQVGGGGETDQNKLRIATPALVGKGKEIFMVQCVSCHGVEGKGNGIAASALNPKPRDFTSGYWKFGGAPTRVFHTITNGSPGTGMASYANLSVEDRYSLAHYVRSLSPNHPDDSPEDLKVAGLAGGKTTAEKPKEEIPVDVAMEKMEVPDQVLLEADTEIDAGSLGAKLFKRDCMACHGMNGMGGKTMALGVNPPVQFMTQSFEGLRNPWVTSQSVFINLISGGIPGKGMPGMAKYSRQEWSDLFNYVKKLAASDSSRSQANK